MMDDEDDDFYDPADTVPAPQHQNGAQDPPADNYGEEYEEEEIEVDEDDDDFNIITEAPADAPPPEAPHPRHANLRAESQRPSSAESPPAPKPSTPILTTPKAESATPVPVSSRPAVPAAPQRPGSSYPPVQVSTIDVHANPVHPTTGKPILLTDMDADFPEDDKPWRRPGSDITDYFNYGFDEFTWASYVLKQQELRKDIGDQKRQLDDMQAFLGMGMPPMAGGPPGPGVPPSSAAPPMPGMPGMPDMSPEMMQGILTSMMAQGLDPTSMDPMTFMQHAQALMGGQSGPGGGQQGQPGFGGQGGGQQQMGYGGGFGGGGRGRGRRW